MATKRQADWLLDPWSVLPIAASVFALALGCVAAGQGAVELLVPATHLRSVALGRYAYILAHLAVGAGSVIGGAISLIGIWKSSDAALVMGQLSVLASIAGLLFLEMFSLWAPGEPA